MAISAGKKAEFLAGGPVGVEALYAALKRRSSTWAVCVRWRLVEWVCPHDGFLFFYWSGVLRLAVGARAREA
ncbi:MAG: hypothetical protein WAN65_00365, partial [Candidatus Sulfotelmatobacter sp.]